MGLILRWFYHAGRRYHAFLRPTVRGQEMAIRSGSFRAVVPVPHGVALDQIADADLIRLLAAARDCSAHPR